MDPSIPWLPTSKEQRKIQEEILSSSLPSESQSQNYSNASLLDIHKQGPLANSPNSSRAAFSKYDKGKEKEKVAECLNMVKDEAKGECSKSFKHMMKERQSREKLSQRFADLYTMNPYALNVDKNSVVQSAITYIKHLEAEKDELLKSNTELNFKRLIKMDFQGEGHDICLSNTTAIPALDSMINALHCLNVMDVKVRTIKTELSTTDSSMTMQIEFKL